MKNKIKRYVDNLFSDIHDTKQLRELKEEVSANLLDKINDFITSGDNEQEAFNKAVSSLGDMSELVESLRKASEVKIVEGIDHHRFIDKKHVIGYVTASAILLLGIMLTGIIYFKTKELLTTTGTLMPFLIISVVLFMYFGLTQETQHEYGMNSKRALAYSLATGLLLFGAFESGFVYFKGQEIYAVLATLMPFMLPSVICYIYLGLTEKSRVKMDSEWRKQWVSYYSNPQSMMLRGNISGALWIFSIAIFFIIGLTLGWKYSWIVFIVAIGFEVLIEAFFRGNRKVS